MDRKAGVARILHRAARLRRARVAMKRSAGVHPEKALLALAGSKPRVAVAFSGGLDSTVLAHALLKARRKFANLRLLHVDHGLQSASAGWARHCAGLARRWRVPIVVMRASIARRKGESPEAAARDARYSLLAQALEPGEVLVTAQHQDDQAETLLLQLFRGAGVAGLAAMPAIAPFGAGRIARPLLGESRAALERYASLHELGWIEDPSNVETRFARNFLRHKVLPVIREKWPNVDSSLALSARYMGDALRLLDATARTDLMRAMDGGGLNVAALRTLSVSHRRNVLRAFIVSAGVDAPSSAQMMEIAGSLLVARADAQPEVRWSGGVMRRRAGRLELEVASDDPPGKQLENTLKSWRWKEEREFIVNGAGDRLAIVADAAGPIDLDLLPEAITLRPRQGGESIRLAAGARTQSLKKLLQAARISVDERARLPLLFVGEGPKGRLVAVGDRWVDASIAANVKSRHRARLKWTRAR
jgi:tRNA(Ile)-lysidine synthase